MNAPRASANHDLVVSGIWHNDDTAGVGLWCKTCETWLDDDTQTMADFDEVTIEHLAAMAFAHRAT